MSRYDCIVKDEKNKTKKVGYMEIKNSNDEKAELFIYGDIVSSEWDKWEDSDTCPQDVTDFLKGIDEFKNVDIYINSGGGSVFAGIAIYNQLKRHNGLKTVHIDGIAASIATVIACAGDKVIIPSGSQFMIHKPSCSYYLASMNADDLRRDADALDTSQKTILDIYMQNVKEGVTEDQINELINAETWFTGKEAAEIFNFEVEEGGEMVACASSYYERYKNTPSNIVKAKNEVEKPQKEVQDPVQEKLENNEENQKQEEINNKLKALDVFIKMQNFI